MPKGGARPGAGRKPGSKTKRNAEVAIIAAQSGITPLEVLVNAMRYHYEKAERTPENAVEMHGQQLFNVKQTLYATACDFAAKAAPYMHPRLANVEHTGANGGPIAHTISEAERKERAVAFLSRVGFAVRDN